DEGAQRATDELAGERDLVAVVAQWRRAGEDALGGIGARGVVERAALEALLGGEHAPGHRRDATHHDAHVARHPAIDPRGRRDRDEGEAPGLAVHRFEVRALSRERSLGHAHLHDQLGRAKGVLSALTTVWRDEEVGELHAALAARARQRDLRVVRDQRRYQIRGRDHRAFACADDRVVAVLTIDREAPRATFEPAHRPLVAEVPAAVALQQVSADRAHRAKL